MFSKIEKESQIEELDRILKLFPKRFIMVLSLMQISCAFLASISYHFFLGDMIWIGPMFTISALIGFLTWFNASKFRYITNTK